MYWFEFHFLFLVTYIESVNYKYIIKLQVMIYNGSIVQLKRWKPLMDFWFWCASINCQIISFTGVPAFGMSCRWHATKKNSHGIYTVAQLLMTTTSCVKFANWWIWFPWTSAIRTGPSSSQLLTKGWLRTKAAIRSAYYLKICWNWIKSHYW